MKVYIQLNFLYMSDQTECLHYQTEDESELCFLNEIRKYEASDKWPVYSNGHFPPG